MTEEDASKQTWLFMPSFKRYLWLTTGSALLGLSLFTLFIGLLESLFMISTTYVLALAFHQAARANQRIVVSPGGLFGFSSLGHLEQVALTDLVNEPIYKWSADSFPCADGTKMIVSGIFYSKKDRVQIREKILQAQKHASLT